MISVISGVDEIKIFVARSENSILQSGTSFEEFLKIDYKIFLQRIGVL